jgi:hypothetical protein
MKSFYSLILILAVGIIRPVTANWEKSAHAIIHDQADATGYSVSFSSPLVAIGAPYNDERGISSGEARIYYHDGKKSVLLGAALQGMESEEFGFSVAVCSNKNLKRVIIGAPRATGTENESGYAKIYDFDDTTMSWVLVGKGISGILANEKVGLNVAISDDGKMVAVAGFGGDGLERGIVRMYTFNNVNEEWEVVGNAIEGHMEGARLGSSLSILAVDNQYLSGLKKYYIGVGSPGHYQSKGMAQVYRYNEYFKDWEQVGDEIVGMKILGKLGDSLSMGLIQNNIILAVGIPNDTQYYGDSRDLQGQVQVYKHDLFEIDEPWEMFADPIKNVQEDDSTGYAIALSSNGMRLAVGSPQYNDGKGMVRVFDLDVDTTEYVQVGEKILGKSSYGEFGFALDVSENEIAIGSPYENMVQIFKADGAGDDIINDDFFEEMFSKRQGLSAFSTFLVIGIVAALGFVTYRQARKRGFRWSSVGKALPVTRFASRRQHEKVNTNDEEWPFPFFTSSERERIAQVMKNESAKGNNVDSVVLHGIHRRPGEYRDEVQKSGSSDSESDDEYELKQIT